MGSTLRSGVGFMFVGGRWCIHDIATDIPFRLRRHRSNADPPPPKRTPRCVASCKGSEENSTGLWNMRPEGIHNFAGAPAGYHA